MKKCFYLWLCLLCLVCTLRAQDIQSSQQAQGYLESKNVSVDYAKGIFQYKVPLYTLGGNSYQLPISLDYIAKGVKMDDVAGMVDHNWMLNVGGVVTRTVRGGIADEEAISGYLWAGDRYGSLLEDILNVDQHKRDGETDIFSVVFKGQTVHFVLYVKEDKICAMPLERTNVRVECEALSKNLINGWIITDEEGNRYIYRQKEWTVDVMQEDAVSFNGIHGSSWISSWYLTRIEPCNDEPIVFSYQAEVNKKAEQTGINITSYYSKYWSKYFYGLYIQEHPFDFSKYAEDFANYIEMGISDIKDFSLEKQLNNQYTYLTRDGEIVRNPEFEYNLEQIELNHRIMGQLVNFSRINGASNELIQKLNELIQDYRKLPNQHAQAAASCFESAKHCVINSLCEIDRAIRTKEMSVGSGWYVRSPLLNSITSAGKKLSFSYKEGKINSHGLSEITCSDMNGGFVSKVVIGRGAKLDSLVFLDNDRNPIGRMKFTYYTASKDAKLIPDIWGYPKIALGEYMEKYSSSTGWDYKVGSLKTITTPCGGKITLDYQANTTNNSFSFGGGIRIKSIYLDDEVSRTHDTISYIYPIEGVLVYDECSNSEILHYDRGFSDTVYHSRVKYKGTAFLNTGNNGVVYPCVQEVIRGKGTKAYWFNASSESFGGGGNRLSPYAFWLIGLPLATAIYDNKGNLKQLNKYKYLTDVYYGRVMLSNFFTPIMGDLCCQYSLPQKKAFEYYINAAEVKRYYQAQGNILLYNDNLQFYNLNPYAAYYLPNIEPRTNARKPKQFYFLYYGGATLLSQEMEYHFETHVTNEPSFQDFLLEPIGAYCMKTEYHYDNPEHSVHPTRIIKTDSKGEVRTTVIKRVTELDDAAHPVIAKMKRKNMLLPVIKEIHLKGDVIQREKVSVYSALEVDTNCYIGLSKEYIYKPTVVKRYISTSTDPILFTQNESDYRLEQSVRFRQDGCSYVPVETETKSDRSVICHNFKQGQAILKARNTSSSFVSAVDLKKRNGQIYNWQDVEDINITSLAPSKRLKLFVVSRGAGNVSYSIDHAGGTFTGNFSLSATEEYTLQCFTLDLNSYTGITSVKVRKLIPQMAYAALVPEEVCFEAIAWNMDGTVFCKFDQTGQMEHYEYEAGGRFVTLKDAQGNYVQVNTAVLVSQDH